MNPIEALKSVTPDELRAAWAAQRRDRDLARRAELVGTVNAARAELERIGARHGADRAGALSRIERLEADLAEARSEVFRLDTAAGVEKLPHERSIMKADRELRETAHPAVKALIRWLGDEAEATRHLLEHSTRTKRNILDFVWPWTTTNRRAVESRASAIRVALERARALEASADPDPEATAAAIRASVPSRRETEGSLEVVEGPARPYADEPPIPHLARGRSGVEQLLDDLINPRGSRGGGR